MEQAGQPLAPPPLGQVGVPSSAIPGNGRLLGAGRLTPGPASPGSSGPGPALLYLEMVGHLEQAGQPLAPPPLGQVGVSSSAIPGKGRLLGAGRPAPGPASPGSGGCA